ncbi:MAG: DeoR family transcriptional regulator [Clostridia bacterium]|nr:DeoR family transcriptional regulator [Clostridia bacterium]MBQ8146948.1 DeoR family transcriptional regulator [Clostridia bacterium]
MTALERRDKIIELLCEKRTVTLSYLINEFKVARSTIQNDILELSLSYPIFTKPGIGGGVYIAKGYYRDKDYLSSLQKETLESLLGEVDDERKLVIESIINKFARPVAP